MKKATDLEKIQAEVEQLQQHNDELTADLKRIQADFINFRRRGEEEKGEFMSHGQARCHHGRSAASRRR